MLVNFLLSQIKQDLGPIGDPIVTGGPLGPFGDAYSRFAGTGGVQVGLSLAKVLSNVLGVITTIGGIWFIIQFVIGAFKWITSGGDKQSVEAAKNHLTLATVGLAILVISYILIGIIGTIVGLDLL